VWRTTAVWARVWKFPEYQLFDAPHSQFSEEGKIPSKRFAKRVYEIESLFLLSTIKDRQHPADFDEM